MWAGTGCANLPHCFWNVLLPRYYLKYYLSWSCIQISRTSPQRRAFLVASHSGVGVRSRVGSCLGIFLLLARACALRRSLFGHTLSKRRGLGVYSTPHGFAYCESSSERWFSSPVGQYFPSRPSSVVTWGCASAITPDRLSRAPRPDCDSPPRPLSSHASVSPSRRKACLSR